MGFVPRVVVSVHGEDGHTGEALATQLSAIGLLSYVYALVLDEI